MIDTKNIYLLILSDYIQFNKNYYELNIYFLQHKCESHSSIWKTQRTL